MNILPVPAWMVLIAAIALQYHLVRRQERWVSFIIPGIYLIIATVTAVQVMQSGDLTFDNVVVTAIVAFLMNNVNTVLMLVMYAKRESDLPSTLIAMFLSYIVMSLVFAGISAIFLYVFGGTF